MLLAATYVPGCGPGDHAGAAKLTVLKSGASSMNYAAHGPGTVLWVSINVPRLFVQQHTVLEVIQLFIETPLELVLSKLAEERPLAEAGCKRVCTTSTLTAHSMRSRHCMVRCSGCSTLA